MNKFLKVMDDIVIAILGKSVVKKEVVMIEEKRNHENVNTRKE